MRVRMEGFWGEVTEGDGWWRGGCGLGFGDWVWFGGGLGVRVFFVFFEVYVWER